MFNLCCNSHFVWMCVCVCGRACVRLHGDCSKITIITILFVGRAAKILECVNLYASMCAENLKIVTIWLYSVDSVHFQFNFFYFINLIVGNQIISCDLKFVLLIPLVEIKKSTQFHTMFHLFIFHSYKLRKFLQWLDVIDPIFLILTCHVLC